MKNNKVVTINGKKAILKHGDIKIKQFLEILLREVEEGESSTLDELQKELNINNIEDFIQDISSELPSESVVIFHYKDEDESKLRCAIIPDPENIKHARLLIEKVEEAIKIQEDS